MSCTPCHFFALAFIPFLLVCCSKESDPPSSTQNPEPLPQKTSFEQKLTKDEAQLILGKASQKTPPKQLQGKTPHVLLILIDDLNDYPLEEDALAPMPALQKFFQRSHLFTHTYAAVPACNPSRAALLSGLSPQRSGSVENKDRIEDADLLRHSLFLPEAFQQAGYETFSVGKIFHGKGIRPTQERMSAMWDEEEHNLGKTVLPAKLPIMPSALAKKKIRWGSVPQSEFFHRDEQIAQAAVQYLGRDHQAPFFCAVGFTIPHLPWFVPEKLLTQIPENVAIPPYPEDAWNALPKYAKKSHKWKAFKDAGMETEILRHYLASCALLDSLLEQVFTQLEQTGLDQDTLVILASDHGYHLGENNRFSKFHLFEQSLRVPMAIALPAQDKGTIQQQPVSLLDIYPTIAELCFLGVPENQLDGRSLVSRIYEEENLDPNLKPEPQPILSWQKDGVSIRTDSWRFTRWKNGEEELYSHISDPIEHVNLLTPEQQAKDPEIQRIRNEHLNLLIQELEALNQKNEL